MPFDFSSYQVELDEHPASAGKYNNLIFAVQKGLNAMPIPNLAGYPGDAGKWLNGAGGWSLPTSDLTAIYRKTGVTELKNTLSTVDLFGGELAIAGGRLGVLGSIRIFASGEFKNDTGSSKTVTLSLQLGTTPLWTSPVASIGDDVHARSWRLKAVIQAMGLVTAQQGGGTIFFSHSDGTTVGMGAIRASPTQITLGPFLAAATNVNMAATQALVLNATVSAKSTDLLMSCVRARVEVTV